MIERGHERGKLATIFLSWAVRVLAHLATGVRAAFSGGRRADRRAAAPRFPGYTAAPSRLPQLFRAYDPAQADAQFLLTLADERLADREPRLRADRSRHRCAGSGCSCRGYPQPVLSACSIADVLQSPLERTDVVNFPLDLLPSVLETSARRAPAVVQNVDGLWPGAFARRGTLDSLMLSELSATRRHSSNQRLQRERVFY